MRYTLTVVTDDRSDVMEVRGLHTPTPVIGFMGTNGPSFGLSQEADFQGSVTRDGSFPTETLMLHLSEWPSDATGPNNVEIIDYH